MWIDAFFVSKNKPDLQFMVDRVCLNPKFRASPKVMFPCKFIRNSNLARPTQPLFDIEAFGVEVARNKSLKSRVGEDVDAENFQIFGWIVWQNHEPTNKRRRCRDSSRSCYCWKHCLGKMPSRCRDFQFRFPGYNINRGSECPIRTVIGNLSRQINRN